MARRYFSSIAQRTTLASGITDSGTTVVVTAATGFPSSVPFNLVLDPDTVNEEIVTVTSRSGVTCTVTRGVSGTSGVAHSSGAVIFHAAVADDFNEASEHVNETTTAHGLTLANVITTTNTKTLTNKTINSASNTLTVAQSAVTSLTTDLAAKASLAATVNAKTDSYTLVAGDSGEVITMDKATANTLTIPSGLAAGYTAMIVQLGAGQTTIAASGTTLRSTPGLKLRTQYSTATVLHLGSEVYIVTGDLSA